MPRKTIPARPSSQFREANPNWRGGRSIASNGYVLIRVGVDHPQADVRGYAYEHRLVAARMLGRWLEPGEIVHHRDEDKTNNVPENLKIVLSHAEHFAHHRKRADLRIPGQINPEIECICGCGSRFQMFDDLNRPRRYIPGHNPQPSPVLDAIRHRLLRGPARGRDLSLETGIGIRLVRSALTKLKHRGEVHQPSLGLWAIKES